MPCEYTRRRPRIANERGRKPSMRDGAAKAREIGEGGVGGERQHQQDGADGDVVENAPARDGGEQHGEDALISGGARIGGGDSVDADQLSDARQQDDQKAMITVRVCCALAAAGSRKALTPLLTASTPVMAVHPLAKALSSSQRLTDGRGRGTAAEPPRASGCPPRATSWRSRWRSGHERAEEQISRNHEDDAGFAHAAQVDQRDQGQNRQAKAERMRLRGWERPIPARPRPRRCPRRRPGCSRSSAPPRPAGPGMRPGSRGRPCRIRRRPGTPRWSGDRRR